MHFAVPIDPHLRTPWSAESAGAAAAGTAPTRAYAIPAVGSNSAIVVLSGTPPQVPVSMYDHPFVSLPQRLVSPTPASCRVDLRRAVTAYPGRRDVVTLLQMAYDLLSRRALCLDELKELALVAGALVEHGMNHQSVDLTHHQASRALERLGLRFLLMDAVVSTFIVLGQDPEPGDWKLFTDTISHAAPTGYFGESRVTAAYTLARELSAAIKTLKGGKRPAPADLFHLKRMLFCSPSSPARFRRPDFDRWRQGSRTDAQ
ncbi:uncharacterized protein EMH_0090650 [Eimeria mitis]|uniref:Uncharacterized protein n=1 Tax=Eimeria mitis TaxID=44415 RepID=U6KM83_9EIME|nr:uncharacterized protein EMH_0090650 [Eimeria mitis]CDJ36568.1 hypothetical protein, conserved [Eimeria mitis]